MTLDCVYPAYHLDLPDGIMARCVDMAPGLLNEVGFLVGNDRFLAHLEAKPALRIDSGRVFFDKDLTQEYIDAFIAKATAALDDRKPVTIPDAWSAGTAGYSMMTIDVATEQLREATCQDLRDMISLANASGIGGSYMVMP